MPVTTSSLSWTTCGSNVALSFAGLCRLQPQSDPFEADKFVDEAFAVGLARRSAVLGDPTDPETPGHPSTWVVGGPDNDADVLLVFGADRAETMQARFEEVKSSAQASGFDVVHEEHGGKLDALGHEHFGFQDGISQPVRIEGRVLDQVADDLDAGAIVVFTNDSIRIRRLPIQS